MNIIEATIAFLFRPTIKPTMAEQQRQKTCRILRDITDPAEAVSECLIEQKTTDHDTAAQRATIERR